MSTSSIQKSGLHGGIDAGGTTFKCGVMTTDGTIIARHRVPVTTPQDTVAACLTFFRDFDLATFGLASFGPLALDPQAENYGSILKTPKPGWSHVPLPRLFADALGLPVHIDTDVNGALLAERHSGAAKGTRSAAYITVGTGIGAGIVWHDHWLGRPYHPEFGHIPLRQHERDRDFLGTCPFHGPCLEGLASVTALKARWGDPLDWSEDHIGWEVAANYLAQACMSLTLTLRLERIVLGGGLMLAKSMLPKVRREYDALLADYLGDATPSADVLIQTPVHGDDAGLRGAILLGQAS